MRVIVVALESSHAVWEAVRLAKTLPKEAHIVVVRPVSLDIACSSRFSIFSACLVVGTKMWSKSHNCCPGSGRISSIGTSHRDTGL